MDCSPFLRSCKDKIIRSQLMAKKRSYALVKVISYSKIIETFLLRLSFNAALTK